MRSFAAAAGLFAAAVVAQAPPACQSNTPCMTATQAQTVANNFETLIKAFSPADAEAWMTPGFTDYSSSVNTLIDSACPNGPVPLDAPTFTNRTAFIAGQGSQPAIPFNQLNLWYTCDTVFIRWDTTVAPGAPETVTGIIAIETEYSATGSEPFLINTVYSEFNSGAWLVDLGVFTPSNCSSAAPKRSLEQRSIPARMA